MHPTGHQSYALPLAIIIGFGMIAAAILFTSGPQSGSTAQIQNPEVGQGAEPRTGRIRPVDDTDYIRGNPNAPIVFIEYSDFDCAFCKNFHDTMNRIMDEYGQSGQVAWVYRHFPLTQLHPNAALIAQAAECVGELGGNDAFWNFTDMVFNERGSNQPTDMTLLPEFANRVGVNVSEYNTCVRSGRFAERVQASYDEAFNAGARGTPYTVILVGNQQATISGAQPYSAIRQVIESLLLQLQGTETLEL